MKTKLIIPALFVLSSVALGKGLNQGNQGSFLKKPYSTSNIGNCFGPALNPDQFCKRHPAIVNFIKSAVGKSDCRQVTKEDLCTITDFDPNFSESGFKNNEAPLKMITKADLEGLYKVRRLVLTFAGISSVAPDAFEGMVKPQADDCYPYNPEEFKKPLRAQAIKRGYSLHYGKTSYPYPTTIDTAPCLAFLDLSHNLLNIADLADGTFSSLNHLIGIELDSTPQIFVDGVEQNSNAKPWIARAELFNGLNSLTDIDVDTSGLTQVLPNAFIDSVNLKDVDFEDNNLKTLPEDLLALIKNNGGGIELTGNPISPSILNGSYRDIIDFQASSKK